MDGFQMPSGMSVGSPVLKIRNIDKVLTFYEKEVGLRINKQYHDDNDDLIYELSSKYVPFSDKRAPLFILQHDPDARDATPHSAGLYHFAILVPNRRSLASTYAALKSSGVHFDGFADHLVSESLYLRDPENNGIEIYRDRPAREWLRDSSGNVMMDTLPLDLQSLLSEVNEEETKNPKAFPSGARIGHMHIKVTNLERSIKFYHEKLMLDITLNWRSMGAAFLSAGGYHHHVGMNTWHSLNGEILSNDEAGLKNFTMTIPDKSSFNSIKSIFLNDHTSERQKIQKAENNQFLVLDPDGIQIVIKSE
jgi:catechol 2,3-dioxygenase